jgi:hypothetical protein
MVTKDSNLKTITDMKRIINYICLATVIVGFYACEIDNLDGPEAAVIGTIYDHKGAPLQMEQGKGSGCIRIHELSYYEEYIQEQELNVKVDGTFRNDKLFTGTYNIYPYKGSFWPVDSADFKEINLRNSETVTVDFTVIPYLEVEWVSEPEIVTYAEGEHPNSKPAGQYFRASAKFKLVTKEGKTHPGVRAGTFCVGNSHFVSAGNRTGDYYGTDFAVTNAQEGETITFVSQRDIEFAGQDYYFRIGFKSADADQKFNYTTIKKLTVNK